MDNPNALGIAKTALQAMLYEVVATPKPGLVDRLNEGAHKDMNILTFVDSSCSIFPTLYSCTQIGMENHTKTPKEVFAMIREVGKKGEEDMFQSTGGINTQKGQIFALGIICTALGIVFREGNAINIESIINRVKAMTSGLVEEELHRLNQKPRVPVKKNELSYGEYLYLKYGITGIRGEVERGFPSVINNGLPQLKKSLTEGKNFNDAMIDTLLSLMAVVEDTNVLWRRGEEGLKYMRKSAQKAIFMGGTSTPKGLSYIREMDKNFIKRNISPGGCADLLAVTIMLYKYTK